MWVWLSLLWLGLPVLAIALATLSTLILRLCISKSNDPRRVFE